MLSCIDWQVCQSHRERYPSNYPVTREDHPDSDMALRILGFCNSVEGACAFGTFLPAEENVILKSSSIRARFLRNQRMVHLSARLLAWTKANLNVSADCMRCELKQSCGPSSHMGLNDSVIHTVIGRLSNRFRSPRLISPLAVHGGPSV